MTIPNAVLVDAAEWAAAKTTVNGQPDDQALDQECFQALANRDKWLRHQLHLMAYSPVSYWHGVSEENDTWTSKWKYDGSKWILNMACTSGGPKLHFAMRLPWGCVVTKYSVGVAMPTGHTALPLELPQVDFYGLDSYEYVIAAASSVAEYEAIAVLENTISRPVYSAQQEVVVYPEAGTNARAGMKVTGVTVHFTSPFAG